MLGRRGRRVDARAAAQAAASNVTRSAPFSAWPQTPGASDTPGSTATGWTEPRAESVMKTALGAVSGPRDVPVGANQHRARSRDCAEHRKLPRAIVFGVE